MSRGAIGLTLGVSGPMSNSRYRQRRRKMFEFFAKMMRKEEEDEKGQRDYQSLLSHLLRRALVGAFNG